jgi:hypothetical protein
MENKDYKYTMADYSNIYLGAKFSYRDVIEHPDVNFKLKAVIERYFLKDLDPDTTLESHFYYMTADEFAAKTYLQLKVKIKFNVLEEKKGLFSKGKRVYTTKILPIHKFMEMNLAQKKAGGVVIQEIVFPKMALMGFVL